MSDTPDLPVPVPDDISALAHLKQIPAMAGAIARLIGKTAKVGEAWLDIGMAEGERRAQALRDDQAAHSALAKAILDAAGPEAIKDPELMKRAIGSWAGERLRKQMNKEGVARKAAEDAERSPPPHDAKAPPDDWMNLFEQYTSNASSDQLRTIWGRVVTAQPA